MKLCRMELDGQATAAILCHDSVVPISAAAQAYQQATGEALSLPAGDGLLPLLPPDGESFDAARRIADWLAGAGSSTCGTLGVALGEARLLVPNPRPNKLFLLAGNYAKHIEEGGGVAEERQNTFPYVFMKPPTTTLTHPGDPITIPRVSPQHIDWELELAVVIGRGGKHIAAADALGHAAGFTIVNDISDRRFRPNPQRKQRPKDEFFDWLHGKWHDSFCPCGPCIASSDSIDDPQQLGMVLKHNGETRQDASTSQQIFSVAEVIEFISQFVTLEAGDMISTGTPAGVGSASGIFLRDGDQLAASIDQIGTLLTPVRGAD